ncbi:MAG: methionine--tRNA ligase [Bacteroidetes bacterium]|nr:methionine--tRNA ligase [Bacteroidota bacterium]
MDKENKKIKRYTITSALPYANGPIHIGHLAGVYIPADIYARYLRLRGEDVLFIGGSDEHGVPITIKARQEGVSPQAIVDRYHEMIKASFKELGISFDIYSRTSLPLHHDTASEFFTTLFNKGKFIEKTALQLYDEANGEFLADRYVTGTCPHCNNDKAYGDQCEKCGTSLNATDLINPRSVLSGNPPVMKETKHWYLPLDQYEPWLREWILEGHKDDWKPNVYGQCKSWIDQGLQPRAVTRDLDWGVNVPLEEAKGKVLYVWFDAPIGYISAAKDWATQKTNEARVTDPAHPGFDWKPYWKSPDTKLVHFIGKDNIVFHCIIFPAMLKAEGSYILPDNVPANEFLNLEGDKISTSRNWAVWLHEYLDDFPGKQDVLRYVLCANAPETKDNDFTWKDFQARNNNELLAIFGNFINRTLVLTQKYFNGKVPGVNMFMPEDQVLIENIAAFPGRLEYSLEHYRFREALNELMNLARLGNKYLTEMEPWKKFREEPDRVETVLHLCLQICANLAILSEPFLPFTSLNIRQMMNFTSGSWFDAGKSDLLPAGHMLAEPRYLFERIDDTAIEAQVKKLRDTKVQNENSSEVEVVTGKPVITYDDFSKMDIRTGTILAAEKVPKTKKLLKLTIHTGVDTRTIVSGIAEFYEPEQLIGRKACFLINLEPRDIKGIQSNGMILMAEDSSGQLTLVSPADDLHDGSTVK